MEKLNFLEKEKIEHSDDLLRMGKYAILVCIFTEIAMLSQLSNTMFMIYAGSTPQILSCHSGNLTFSSNLEACQEENWKICQNHSSQITFDRQFYGITEQFLLFCDDAKLEKLGISIQMFGLMLGCLVFGQIADSYGRRIPMLICLIMCTIFGILSAFANNFWIFTALRTILSFFNGGQCTVSVVYMIENVPKKSRMYLSTLISFSPNVILLGILAWFFQKWDHLAIVISVLILPSVIIISGFLHESPRWLMQKGKIDEAQKTILKINKFDGSKSRKLDPVALSEILKNEHAQFSENSSKTQHSFKDLVSTKQTAIGTFVIGFTFFSTTFINYANMFNLGSISGSIYMNSIMIGSLRYSVSIFCGFLDFKYLCFNRKISHGLCSLMTICAILVTILIKVSGESEAFGIIVRFCVLLSCTMTSQAIIVASVTCNELMPTAIRSLAYSVAQLSSRFGIVLSPHLFFLHLYIGDGLDILPYLIALLFAVADLIFFKYLIPETKNKPLEDHIRK
ncbi:unnamed protein product [Caenorhabditis angaria]|uniref:Major facilitator superfamily (MFS) profile domain-containing protein n=1 Tax=Caenorhabditis angaria TaxID=860376 RepID=A0A9P1IYH1_9PELO|nr:unnamed protein product [Caenorhabditis angaria]